MRLKPRARLRAVRLLCLPPRPSRGQGRLAAPAPPPRRRARPSRPARMAAGAGPARYRGGGPDAGRVAEDSSSIGLGAFQQSLKARPFGDPDCPRRPPANVVQLGRLADRESGPHGRRRRQGAAVTPEALQDGPRHELRLRFGPADRLGLSDHLSRERAGRRDPTRSTESWPTRQRICPWISRRPEAGADRVVTAGATEGDRGFRPGRFQSISSRDDREAASSRRCRPVHAGCEPVSRSAMVRAA